VDTQVFEGRIDEVRISATARSDDWLETSYYSGANALLKYGGDEALQWWDSDWNYRRRISVDHERVDGVLYNFPVAVFLNTTNFNFDKAQNDGGDLRFVSMDASTVLKYEIESWNVSGENAVIWVKVPVVSAVLNTLFYMYYGNSTVANGESPEEVWDTRFELVQHLEETARTVGTYNDHLDSTDNDHDGEALSGVIMDGTGQIDGADLFDGFDDGVAMKDIDLPDRLTMEAWVYANSLSAGDVIVAQAVSFVEPYVTYGLTVGASNTYTMHISTSGSRTTASSAVNSATTGRWQHVAGVWTGSAMQMFVNGAPSGSSVSKGGSLDSAGDDVHIGYASYGGIMDYFDGYIDECRLSATSRSSQWLKANFHAGIASGSNALLSYGYEEIEGIPVHTSSRWNDGPEQQLDADTDSVDIANAADDSFLQFQVDDGFIFFQFYTEAAPEIKSYTYSVLLDDAGDGTYDYCISSYGNTDSVRLYKWSAVNGWDNADVKTLGDGYYNMDTDNNVVQFAVDFIDTFDMVVGDEFYAATYDEENNAFEDGGGDWEATNNPMPADATEGDYTKYDTIPEFSNYLLPTGGFIILFVLTRKRTRKRRRVPYRTIGGDASV
jgi:hypothetical protein